MGDQGGRGSREAGRLSRSRYTLDQQQKLQLGPGAQKRTDPGVSPRTIPHKDICTHPGIEADSSTALRLEPPLGAGEVGAQPG